MNNSINAKIINPAIRNQLWVRSKLTSKEMITKFIITCIINKTVLMKVLFIGDKYK